MGIIIKPLVTEKMTAMSEKFNRYAFIVDPKANKIEIKDAVKKLYGVDVVSPCITAASTNQDSQNVDISKEGQMLSRKQLSR